MADQNKKVELQGVEASSKEAEAQRLVARENVRAQALRIAEKVKSREALTKGELAFIDDLRAIKEGMKLQEDAIRKDSREAMRDLLKEKVDAEKGSELEQVYEQIRASLDDLRANVDKDVSGKFGGVISEEFGYGLDFKETTKSDEFLDMLRAIRKLHADGKNEPEKVTIADWKEAGHDGEWIFDQAELDEINAFYKHILETNRFAKIERILATCKNGGDLVRYMLASKDVSRDAKRDISGVALKDSDKKNVSKIEKEKAERDTLDILLDGETTWNTKQFRYELLRNVNGKDNREKTENAYKIVTGEAFPKDFESNPEAAVAKFQESLRAKTDILNQLAKTVLVLDGKKKIDGTSGLSTILSGEFSSRVESLAAELSAKLADKPLPEISGEERSNMLRTAVKYGLPIAVALLSKGAVIADYDSREVEKRSDFDALCKQYGKDASVLMIIHDVLVGKRFSLRFGENHAIENYVKEVREFLDAFNEVAAGKFDAVAIAAAPERYRNIFAITGAEYAKVAAKLGDEKATLLLREALFKTVNISAAKAAKEGDWSFRISPFFIGGARESVKAKTSFDREKSSDVTAKLGKERKLSASDLLALGIQSEKKADKDGKIWYGYAVAAGKVALGNHPETEESSFQMETNDKTGEVRMISSAPLSFVVRERTLPSGELERTVDVKKVTLSSAAMAAGGADTFRPNLDNDAKIMQSVAETFKDFRSVDRYGKFPKVQYEIAGALSGKAIDRKVIRSSITNPVLAKRIETLLDFAAGCGSDEKRAMVYSAMLAEMAGDQRIRNLSKREMPKGKTLKALRGDAWGHGAAFDRRLNEVGMKDRGNTDAQRDSISSEVEKLSTLKGSKKFSGVLSFTNFSQVWRDSTGKMHKGFQWVPYTGTEVKLVGEPKELDAPKMRESFVAKLPVGVLDTFVADIEKKRGVKLTREEVQDLLSHPGKEIKEVGISAKFKLGLFEKCLNDVYFFDSISYCGGGVDCKADVSGAPVGALSTEDAGNYEEAGVESMAGGISPAGILLNKALSKKNDGGSSTPAVETRPGQETVSGGGGGGAAASQSGARPITLG